MSQQGPRADFAQVSSSLEKSDEDNISKPNSPGIQSLSDSDP